jgi:hypothetical protein
VFEPVGLAFEEDSDQGRDGEVAVAGSVEGVLFIFAERENLVCGALVKIDAFDVEVVHQVSPFMGG